MITQQLLKQITGNLVPPGTLTPSERKAVNGFEERSTQQQQIHEAILGALRPYSQRVVMNSRTLARGEKIEWDVPLDQLHPGAWIGQNTGSCVGANGANVLFMQMLMEDLVLKSGEPFDADWWWLYAYGWSRYFGGMTDEGDGSYESVYLKALKEKGFVFLEGYEAELTAYEKRDGCRWLPDKVEYKWAARKNIESRWDDVARKNRVLDGAMISTLDELNDALWLGPVGIAGMLGTNKVRDKDGVRLADWDARWAHKMGVSGIWNHPNLGMIYKIMNRSWGSSQFNWFWIIEKTMAKYVKDNGTEISVIRDFDGLESAGVDLEWLLNFLATLMASIGE